MRGDEIMNDNKKTYSVGPSTLIFAGSAIGVLLSFVLSLGGKRKKLATVGFLVSFAGLIYGALRQFGIMKREEEELLTIELEDDENEEK